MKEKVAVIILNYMSWRETISELLLCNEKLQIDYKNIIVVDNNSPNDSKSQIESFSHKNNFVFLTSSENRGYGAGNNIGLRYAISCGYKYALIINNDIEFTDNNLIKELLSVFEKDKTLAVVIPDIYSPTGYLFNRDSVKPTFFDYTIGMLSYKRKGRLLNRLDGYGYVYRPQGCCMMGDLDKISEINFFDENVFLYYEECILAERLLEKGYLCACNFNSRVIHNHSRTVKSVLGIRKIINIYNSSFSYYLTHYRKFNCFKTRVCCIFNWIKMYISFFCSK